MKIATLVFSSIADEPQIRRRAGSYLREGYQVEFVGMDRLATKKTCEIEHGLRCRYLLHGWGFANGWLLIGLSIWWLKLLWYCLRMKTDLVHVFELDSSFIVSIACRVRRLRFIYDVLDNYELRHQWIAPLKWLIRAMEWFVLSSAAAVILPDSNRMVGPFKHFKEKVSIIHLCPPDLQSVNEYRRNHPTFTICAMGNLTRRRGIELLLEASRKLENVRIVMAGQFLDRGLKDTIESMPAVEFRGHVSWEESAHLAAGADAIFTFFDPRTEVNIRAASQKWYEALMVGRPILCNREIMNARWIQDNNIGFLSSYEIDDLVVTLRYMSKHRDEALSKGSHGRTLFEEGYNWASMEKRLMCVADRVMRASAGETTPICF